MFIKAGRIVLVSLSMAFALAASARADTYSYDALGRLTSVVTNNGTVTFTYDAAGNRTAKHATRLRFKFVVVPVGGGKLIFLPG